MGFLLKSQWLSLIFPLFSFLPFDLLSFRDEIFLYLSDSLSFTISPLRVSLHFVSYSGLLTLLQHRLYFSRRWVLSPDYELMMSSKQKKIPLDGLKSDPNYQTTSSPLTKLFLHQKLLIRSGSSHVPTPHYSRLIS